MKIAIKREAFTLGLAMFSMFFGAGNIIFPLALGQYARDKTAAAMFGLSLTATLMPILGVIAMILFEGNYRAFFGRLGRVPGFLAALLTISLLGPLGSTPRCISLAHVTFRDTFGDINVMIFNGCACALIFLLTWNRKHLIAILGKYLTPLLLLALATIVAIGFYTTGEYEISSHTHFSMFTHGLKEGYKTMDLLAAFFFSTTILNALRMSSATQHLEKKHLQVAYQASFIGALLLAVAYFGFSYIAAWHTPAQTVIQEDQLLAAIALKLLGPAASLFVGLSITLACLTTAIALIVAFADFIHTETSANKFSYKSILAASLLLTFCVSTFEYSGIALFLNPLLNICYPALIVLTLLNIAKVLTQFEPCKLPVYGTFAFSLWEHIFFA